LPERLICVAVHRQMTVMMSPAAHVRFVFAVSFGPLSLIACNVVEVAWTLMRLSLTPHQKNRLLTTFALAIPIRTRIAIHPCVSSKSDAGACTRPAECVAVDPPEVAT